MKHSTGKPTKAQRERFEKLRAMGCIACWIDGRKNYDVFLRCGPVEIHHLNLGGKAGQKRRGHDFTLPLGAWHHRAICHPHFEHAVTMEAIYGPSLARAPRKFRERYGSDDELLAQVNALLAARRAA